MPIRRWIVRLQERLHTKHFGRVVVFSCEVRSTNEWAKELAVAGASHGTVVVAETQKSGRGRLAREWISPAGGLWFSLILRPNLHPAEAAKLTFVAGLAVADVLNEMFGLNSETKWPNDVLVNKRKICGVLSEMSTTGDTINFVVVGVGINVNFEVEDVFPKELKEAATSLESELGRKVRLEELFIGLLERLESLYEFFLEKGFSPVLEKWKNYAGFLGCKVKVTSQTEDLNGLALDVDYDGSLILRLENETLRHILVGDVSLNVQ